MTWQDEAWQAFEDLGEPKPLPLVHKIKPLNLNGVQMPADQPDQNALAVMLLTAINARLAELPPAPDGFYWAAEFVDDELVAMHRRDEEHWVITWHPRLRAILRPGG